MRLCLLLKLGEMVLKGLNRSRFEQALLRTVVSRIEPFGGFEVYSKQSTVFVMPDDDSADILKAAEACKRVFGIASVCLAVRTEADLDKIFLAASRLEGLSSAKTFKIESKRADKSFPLSSPQLSAEIGGRILERFPHLSVDVHNPDFTVWVEIREGGAYIHPRPSAGAGGLPPGMGGSAVLLLSGGIDSPVAGWRMARRGAALLPVHFHSYPYTSREAEEKVLSLAKILSGWTGGLTVRMVPFTEIQEKLRKICPESLYTLMMRRSMIRMANTIAHSNSCGAIITGESLGQVASQTMEALHATGSVSQVPIFQPLIGMDKEEVVATARHIGTFETSILPYEDCCTVFTPKHPKTKPNIAELQAVEDVFEYSALEKRAVENIRLETVRSGGMDE